MSKQALVKNEEIPDQTEPVHSSTEQVTGGAQHAEDLPPEYTPHADHQVPGQELNSYPGQAQPPYTQQPPLYQPYPGQTYVDPNTQHVIVPVVPPPVVGVQDYLVHNIMVLVFCCLPIGIVGVIKSSECRSAVATGDTARAQRLSSEAKKLAITGCGCGSVVLVAVIVFYVVLYAAVGYI